MAAEWVKLTAAYLSVLFNSVANPCAALQQGLEQGAQQTSREGYTRFALDSSALRLSAGIFNYRWHVAELLGHTSTHLLSSGSTSVPGPPW